jgi:predicted nucleic acid-binding protein
LGGQLKRNAGDEMSIIVDTSVWIDSFNPKIKTPEKEVLIQLIQNDYPIYLCPVIYQEILQGIREDKTFERIKFILRQYRMIDIDIMYVTNHAIDLYRHLRKKGITIRKSIDCLIASYAIMADMYLLHNDNDFTQIAGESKLKIYPSET